MPTTFEDIPLPASFPAGSKFWDLEGSGVAMVGDAFLMAGGGGSVKRIPLADAIEGGRDSIPARLSRSGFEITESEFRDIAA